MVLKPLNFARGGHLRNTKMSHRLDKPSTGWGACARGCAGGIMRRVSSCLLLCVALMVLAILILPTAASPAAGRLNELSAREDVLKWIDGYPNRPDPAA